MGTLRYVTGHGPAVSAQLYRELGEAVARGGEHSLVVLVPEQYTLSSEREILAALNLPGSFRLMVLSPGRLCSLVFEEAGAPQPVRIDDRGRVMLLHGALAGLSGELTWYRGAQHRRGFSEMAAQQIKEFKQAGHTPESLLALAEGMHEGALRGKLTDLSRVWALYEEALSGRFMDGEDEVARAMERVDRARSFRDCEVWAYGFELVSQTLGSLLTGLCGVARQVNLMLPMENDEHAPDEAVYRPVRNSLAHLDRLAKELRIPRARTYLKDEEQAQDRGELSCLERELFRYPCAPWQGPVERVRLAACKNPLQEAMLAMAWARRMMREKGWRCRDIAVTGANLAPYQEALRRAAELYGIELFLPEERPADRHPLCQYVLLALLLIDRGWKEEEMQLMLRTGFCGLTAEEADRVALYAQTKGMKGRAWLRPLTGEEGEALEPLRQKLIAPLLRLKDDLTAAKDAREQMLALWRLLTETGAYGKLQAQQERLKQQGALLAMNESAQVWNRLLGAMDQLQALLGNTHLPPRELYELLSQSLAASALKPLPQSNDALTVGALNRLRGRGLKAIVFIGCAGEADAQEKGLFLSAERRVLEEGQGMWLSPDAYERTRLAALDVKRVLSLAQEAVLFTYPQSGEDGGAVQPSALVQWIRRVLPALPVEGGLSGQEALSACLYETPAAALELLPARLSGGELTGTDRAALGAIARLPECEGDIDRLREALTHRVLSDPLPEKLAKRLYEGPAKVSVTRLERFAACPFKHFVKYGLDPKEPDPVGLDPRSEGTFYHTALERFMKLAVMPVTEQTLDESMERMDEVTDGLLSELVDVPLAEDPVLLARSRRLRSIARTAAKTAARHLVDSKFQPAAFEVDFNGEVTLHTGLGDVPVEGRIDRMDRWTEQGRNYLRIIDYKSGSTEVNLVQLYWGLQLQLLVYLAAGMHITGGQPAGAFYFHVKDPTVDTQERDGDAVDAERRKKLRLSGYYLSDPEVLEAMARDVKETLDVKLKQDGSVGSDNKALTGADFDALLKHTLSVAQELTRRIQAGRTDIAPVRIGKYDACQYCDYRAVCQADPRVEDTHDVKETLTSPQALERMRAEAAAPVEG